MARTCDHCGGEMTLRGHETDADAAASGTTSATWWDCGCGRTVGEFAASMSAELLFTQEEDQR